ncbi:MAG: succinate--CoA ligase subunit beta, partial [Gammaproteobacteria bacterium]|nr:succinate--CoA ligase subunit beta [Gammaproteobacteria bacterium]
MNIHEYQAKGLLAKFGVAVPRGQVAFTPVEAEVAAQELGGSVWVVKAQIHAGGRGKGGGVKVVKSIQEVKSTANQILGMNLVTHQTGPEGKEVKRVYIEEGCDIARELYLSFLLDRATSWVTVMASTEGGMDIEKVAAETPEKIIKVAIDPATGLQPYHARQIAFGLGLEGPQIRSAVKFLQGMYKAYIELDASLVEINPLVVTGAGDLIALDAKMNFDNNGLFRQKEVAGLRDESEEDASEL